LPRIGVAEPSEPELVAEGSGVNKNKRLALSTSAPFLAFFLPLPHKLNLNHLLKDRSSLTQPSSFNLGPLKFNFSLNRPRRSDMFRFLKYFAAAAVISTLLALPFYVSTATSNNSLVSVIVELRDEPGAVYKARTEKSGGAVSQDQLKGLSRSVERETGRLP
jgi:hypothetical protein